MFEYQIKNLIVAKHKKMAYIMTDLYVYIAPLIHMNRRVKKCEFQYPGLL